MASAYFDFKQFRIIHDRSSMRVGTDGVLVGAWTELDGCRRILDVGCGCGLIAIMLAQRTESLVEGVDIDASSVEQAVANAGNSPFSDRLHFYAADIRTFGADGAYDCLVSNPPYFEEELLPPDRVRAAARHTSALGFAELLQAGRRLLCPDGRLNVIVPTAAVPRFLALADVAHFSLRRRTDVVTRLGKQAKRTLLCLGRNVRGEACRHDVLELCDASGQRSVQYAALTRDYYL